MNGTRFRVPRRRFLAASAAAAVGIPYWHTAAARGAAWQESRPKIGCIGVGGQGLAIARSAARFGEILAVCDADLRHAQAAREALGDQAAVYQDYRELLARDDVEVVLNGTPDHWHTPINIAACRAGKDIYTEKPLTLTIEEGKLLCDVVRQTGRIVQVGTQQRSDRAYQLAVELVRNGRLGQLRQVWVALPYFSAKGGPFEAEPVPAELDWDLYQGQAPEHPYCRQRTHSDYRWWYEYAGGIITDWGNHHYDIAHWGMDCERTGPVSVEARGLFPNGGRPQHYNTPDRFFARMEYANGVELLYFASLGERLHYGAVDGHVDTTPAEAEWLFGADTDEEIKTFSRNGVMFIGERGRIFVNRGGVYGRPVEELEENPLPDDAWRAPASLDHMANFFECVATREQPVSTVEVQHRTITACHLTNISLQLEQELTWDPEQEVIVGNSEARARQSRVPRTPYSLEG